MIDTDIDIDAKGEGDLDVRGLFGTDDAVRPGFSEVRLTVSISGPESPERYEELGPVVESRCPVQVRLRQPHARQ
ncbi:hypothetical protein IEE91_03220 [Kocuria sp. cx-455]|uniref:hypothetical protein n=1 Tax=Kocuria sp. cx-455 TaxID=2771377 RepID=UPI0016863B8E|nr:hypothetical protein [Kocuria sp. cx-455]MBD2764221.1 hypothetical protein [Kocuria sp. cx-455]